MSIYGCNMNLELQQRAVEYNSIIKNHENLREGLFEQMPALEMKTNQSYTNGFNGDELSEDILTEEELQQQQLKQQQEAAKTLLNIFSDDTAPGKPPQTVSPTAPPKQSNVDLLDSLFDGSSDSLPVMQTQSKSSTGQHQAVDLMSNTADLLDCFVDNTATNSFSSQVVSSNIFDMLDMPTKTPAAAAPPSSNSADLNDLLGLSDSGAVSSMPLPAQQPQSSNDILSLFGPQTNGAVHSSVPSIVGYDKNDLKITFEPVMNKKTASPNQQLIQMTAHNTSIDNTVKEFLFGVAVPRSMQMQLSQPTTSLIQPLDSMKQTILITNPNKVTF